MSLKCVGIHYITAEVEKLYQSAGVMEKGSSGFDLMNVEEVKLDPLHRYQLINLGVVIELPKGYHALLMPRSSTFKNWEIIQTNSVGLVDESYKGIKDIWRMPAYYLGWEPKVIPAGTRICQFLIEERNSFSVYSYGPDDVSRGGDGSTGR